MQFVKAYPYRLSPAVSISFRHSGQIAASGDAIVIPLPTKDGFITKKPQSSSLAASLFIEMI